MENFVGAVSYYLDEDTNVTDQTSHDWAVRAFSVLGALGSHEDVNGVVGTVLARLLAKAPEQVLQEGTLMILLGTAVVEAQEGNE
jgi:hypothetical protein